MAEGMSSINSAQSQPPTTGLPNSYSLDPFARIPPEICAMFLSLLPAEDLIAASHVSSFLRSQCLDDSLYVPLVKPRLDVLLENTKSLSRDISGYTSTEVKGLVCKLPRVSATSYFDDIGSIREFFLRQHFLTRSWHAGRPQSIQTLQIPIGYQTPDRT